MTANKIVCVDSCVFISYLKGDDSDRTAEEKANLNGFFTDFMQGKVHVIFPTFERSEILACELPDGAMDLFDEFIARPNLDEVPTSTGVSKIAADVRNDLWEKIAINNSLHRLTTPDAIVLATAIAYKCDFVYTFDGARPTKKDRRLLSFSGMNLAGYILHIKRPESNETEMILSGGAGGS